MKVKEWKYNDMMNKVTGFGDIWMNLDVEREESFGTPVIDANGFVTFTCRCEIVKETEKAIQVNFADSWKEWLPKSCVVM